MNQVQNTENNFPGCLGRMVNLFDLANGVGGNRLLTNKPHHNGSSLARSQSDVVRMMGAPFGDQIEDKMIVSEFRRCSSNKKASGTPMKTLIAQELNKEVESKQKPSNLVAKLMGLDALPHQHQPNSGGGAQRSHSKGYSRRSLSHSGILTGCWEPDRSFLDKEIDHCPEMKVCKDTYEVWQQTLRDDSPQKRRPDVNVNDRKMALIRQKFMELKCLATDEKGRQSKEFQDALDILSSNRDLLLKFFQEPNSMFSQHLYDMLSIPPPPETKRITVLRPSTKVADSDNKSAGLGKKGDKKATKPGWDGNDLGCSPTFPSDDYSSQPTRIVVLKPSPARTFDIKAVVSPPLSTPRAGLGEELCDEADDHGAQESKEVASEITRQVRENLMGHRRDETFLSSVFSNGYICDDSSFNKSEAESANGNLSDSEIASPTSRHSWDYINRFDSPFSSASFSRASCSPESSVCREAKKRLSERWAMMTSTMNSQEQNSNARRSSSTLGEMLALSETKKSVASEDRHKNKEPELEASTSYLVSNQNKEEGIEESPRSLVRSKSLPVSSSIYGGRLNVEISDSEAVKPQVPKELTKAKSMKSSLRGKVSGLFFSKSKKSKDKSSASLSQADCQSVTSELPNSLVPHPGRNDDDGSSRISKNGTEECCSSSLDASHEGVLTVAKPVMERNANENQDQPSPISVLEAPFEEDDINITELCASIKLDRRGPELLSKSNLIDKSPPIGSISRTLSWDDSSCSTDTSSSSYPLKATSSPSSAEEEERDMVSFMDTLLSAAELQGDSVSSARWHSADSPLDPCLRDKLASQVDKEIIEAKKRQMRSTRKLLFDCLNVALLDMITSSSSSSGGPATTAATVVGRMREWVGRRKSSSSEEEEEEGASVVVERVVRKEVAGVGKGWTNEVAAEVESIGKEIGGKLLEELVEEAVVDLTGRTAEEEVAAVML
ncbi:hypothetical protein LINPERHAP2_LOCUS6366 [Linum perenne]